MVNQVSTSKNVLITNVIKKIDISFSRSHGIIAGLSDHAPPRTASLLEQESNTIVHVHCTECTLHQHEHVRISFPANLYLSG